MLNPHQPGCLFPSKELSAVGVTFLMLMALRKQLREHDTVARLGGDVVPAGSPQ